MRTLNIFWTIPSPAFSPKSYQRNILRAKRSLDFWEKDGGISYAFKCKSPGSQKKTCQAETKCDISFVTDMGSQLTQIYINKMFRALVDQMILDQGFWQEPNMTITGDFKVRLNQRGLLSVTQEIYSYVKLAAHGLTVQKSLTFDLLSGQQLILKDLFKWDSDYKAYLSQIIKQQIKERDIPLLTEFKSINDDQDFYLTPDNLVIYFQLYEYTPYVYGILEFKIPYQQLKPIIGKDSPLNRLLKP